MRKSRLADLYCLICLYCVYNTVVFFLVQGLVQFSLLFIKVCEHIIPCIETQFGKKRVHFSHIWDSLCKGSSNRWTTTVFLC